MDALRRHVQEKARAVLVEMGHSGEIPAVEAPRDLAFGDAAMACFPLAKALRKNPAEIAARVAAGIEPDQVVEKAEAAGPYVNVRFRFSALARSVLGGVLEGRSPYGKFPDQGKTVVIDYSSPNIAKPFSVGLIRTTVIGAALYRIYSHAGWRTVGVNHLGDWGSQFGKVLAALERWGDREELRRNPIRHTLELYVRYHKEEEKDPALAERAREIFRKLEEGDQEVRALWKEITELSLREFQKTYDRLGITFDVVQGESFYEPYLEETIRRVVEAGITEISEGALVVRLGEGDEPPCLLRKSDGTTLYLTRDLAAVFHRWEKYRFHKCLYVVGGEQKLHFRQLKGILKKMGLEWWDRIEHVAFGLIRFKDGRMSTRHGKVVFLDEVLDRAVEKVREIIREKNPDLPDKEKVAELVGVGAVVFNDLKNGRIKDVRFDLEEMLNFEGETGPYVQYAGARLSGILRNAAQEGLEPADPGEDLSLLEDAREVVHALGSWGDALGRALRENEPSQVTAYTVRLARSIHSYLHDHRVLGVEKPLSRARLLLVSAARRQLERGLGLIGVACPEEM